MRELQRLQDWYQSQCDEDWEHSFGVKIDTMDNPGWIVRVDLTDTDLSTVSFDPIHRGDSDDDRDWIHCKVESGQFIGCGGTHNLEEILEIFLKWAGQ